MFILVTCIRTLYMLAPTLEAAVVVIVVQCVETNLAHTAEQGVDS